MKILWEIKKPIWLRLDIDLADWALPFAVDLSPYNPAIRFLCFYLGWFRAMERIIWRKL